MSQLHVVTGASGHVGANLIPALLEAGHRVRAVTIEPLDTPLPALAGLEVERVQADVCDRASLDPAFAGADVVHHLAAVISVRMLPDSRVRAVNIGGVANVIDACRRSGARRLVHMSSIHALTTGRRIPKYDRSKAAGEQLVIDAMQAGLDAVIVRPTGIIGPRDFAPSRMGRIFLDLARRRLPAMVSGGFNWVDVRDVAAAVIAAGDHGRPGERYTVSGYWRSISELAAMAGMHTGVYPPLVTVPLWLGRAVAPVGGLVSERFSPAALRALQDHENVACDLAFRDLGHWPRPMADTIADIYRSFDALGLLQPRRRHRGRTTSSTGGGNRTSTGDPMASSAGDTELTDADASATTLPTSRINGSSSSDTTTTL